MSASATKKTFSRSLLQTAALVNSAGSSTQTDEPSESTNSAESEANKAKRWGVIQTDLASALNTWDVLEAAEPKQSPEEEQLQKIKTIIGQLKDKLEQF